MMRHQLRSNEFSTIVELQPAKMPMLNQAVVVHLGFFQLAPASKSLVIKTMMRRFQISDAAVADGLSHRR